MCARARPPIVWLVLPLLLLVLLMLLLLMLRRRLRLQRLKLELEPNPSHSKSHSQSQSRSRSPTGQLERLIGWMSLRLCLSSSPAHARRKLAKSCVRPSAEFAPTDLA